MVLAENNIGKDRPHAGFQNYPRKWLAPVSNSRTQLQLHWFMQHLVYSVRYSVVPINSTLLTIPL